MATKNFCDRCGSESHTLHPIFVRSAIQDGNGTGEQRREFCEECGKKVLKAIKTLLYKKGPAVKPPKRRKARRS